MACNRDIFTLLLLYELKFCGNPASRKSVGVIFPTACARFACLCHILVILPIFKTFSLLLYYINLIDETATGFERTDSSFERSSVVGRMLTNSIACCRVLSRETSLFWFYFNKLPQPPSWPVSSHQHGDNTLHQQKDNDSLKAQMMVSIF
jgi:hypothetical protein